jgi:hypothetical protein
MTSSWIKEFKMICQRLLFRIVEVVSSVLFWVVYHGSGEKMPPIENLLLLDSATAIAHKIRTRKVRFWRAAWYSTVTLKYSNVMKFYVLVTLGDLKAHHNTGPLQNPVVIHITYFLKIHFNVILLAKSCVSSN